ncbi:MAG: lysophospholipid acyltransferase family protein [Desulforhabdus sp.]|jgi:1-acyl-sn-glycerol-3-phosphate acyltransferase|nr:lysophospholipid acyltransferase family protein [Desulforhabdus sp.]
MKASKLEAYLIVLKSLAITLWISIETIYKVYRGIETREQCDRRLRWWSAKLLSYLRLSYASVNPKGVSFTPGKPYIIMSNHSSLCDIPLIFVTMPGSIRMLTKKELFDVPIWGRGMREGEFISVDRDNRRQALKDLQEAQRKMESGIILWVAPEGTRSQTGKLGHFKKGGFMLAMKTGATIIPVGIRGAFHVLPAKTLDFQLGSPVEVHIGEPVDASKFTAKTRNQLMQQVEQQLLQLTGQI